MIHLIKIEPIVSIDINNLSKELLHQLEKVGADSTPVNPVKENKFLYTTSSLQNFIDSLEEDEIKNYSTLMEFYSQVENYNYIILN